MINKRRGKTPSLISLGNGGIEITHAKKLSKCKGCRSSITKGTVCGDLKVGGSGFSSRKRYCRNCVYKILEETESGLQKIKSELDSKSNFINQLTIGA